MPPWRVTCRSRSSRQPARRPAAPVGHAARLGRHPGRARHLRAEPRWRRGDRAGGGRRRRQPWRRERRRLRPGRPATASACRPCRSTAPRPGARHRARTVLRFTRDGVAYTVIGSVPPTAAERAARGAVTERHDGPAPLEVRGLVKRYGELTAVAGVDLTVNVGDVYGYLGPNGAGKTTSLRMMLGLIRPTAGTVRLFGRDPMESVRALEGVAGFVEAPTFYPYLTAQAQPRAARRLRRRRRAQADRRGARVRRADRSRRRQGRRLLARHAPAARDRRGAAARPEAAAARRARDGARPGRDARHAPADPAAGRPGDDGAALEPPAGRGRGGLQPRRDRPHREDRLRGRDRRAQARRRDRPIGSRRPTTSARWRSAALSRGSTTSTPSMGGSRSRLARRRPPSSHRR